MDDALRVGGGQRIGEPDANFKDFVDGPPACRR